MERRKRNLSNNEESLDIQFYFKKNEVLIVNFLKNYFSNHAISRNPSLKTLYDSIFYSITSEGKRIRPILTIATGEAVGGDINNILPIACAIEMIHTYSLIHDDLPAMDDDDFRRGKPSTHKAFNEAIAILTGNALLSEAFIMMSSLPTTNNIDSNVILDIMKDVATATGTLGMIGGQVIDIEAKNKDLSFPELEALHIKKTGALIKVAITSGAKISMANEKSVECLARFSENLGLAFQIVDDILDHSNDEGNKKGLNKATYTHVCGLNEAKERANELTTKALSFLHQFDAQADHLRNIAKYVVGRINH